MLSRFLKTIPLEDGKFCLFSTRYGSSIIVEGLFLEKIKEGSISKEERKILSSLGFIVEDQNKELEEVFCLIEKLNQTRNVSSFLIVLNLDCNLSCPYCYEGTQKGKKYMDKFTVERTVAFIEQKMQNGKNISIDFYGGEPLLSYEVIVYFMEKLNQSANKFGVKITYNIVTNGTLLTCEKAESLKKLGLISAKITIDGDEENHNKFRPYKYGLPSFKDILENIKNTSSILKIQLGGNYTKENYKNFPKLLDRLLSEGIGPDKLNIVKFDPISAIDKRFSHRDFSSGCVSINEPWIAEASVYLREEILRRGYNTIPLLPSVCAVEVKDDLIINFNGDIYKCPAFLGFEEFKIGNVFKEAHFDYKMYDLNFRENRECIECLYLPMCFGGCRYLSYLKTGKIGIDCKKDFFESTLHRFIQQDIKFRNKEN